MAFKVTTIYHRPSLETMWHIEYLFGSNSPQYVQSQVDYDMNSRRVVSGANTLTLTITNTWDSEEQFTNYTNDLRVIKHMVRVEEYHESCGITVEPRVYQEL
jgi:hypothetical protein